MSRRILGTKILAREQKETTTDSGIVIPDTASTEGTVYEVEAIGAKVENVYVGDKVYVLKKTVGSYATLMYQGEELTVLDESNVIMVES